MDILLSEEAARLIDSFASAMNVQTVFYSRDRQILKRGCNGEISSFCEMMQNQYFRHDECASLDYRMQQVCEKEGRPFSYQCHAGLNEIIAPVKTYNNTIGYIMLGQFRTSRTPPEFIRHDPQAVKKFRALPYFSPRAVANLEDMLKLLIDYVVNKELVRFARTSRYRALLSFIKEHLSAPLSLQQAARHLGISPSSLSHFLSDEHGTTFKRLLIESRLEEAEAFWKEHSDATVSEVSLHVGYGDARYFSRLYSKKRGRPPSSFHAEL